jgi:hypothetical protein
MDAQLDAAIAVTPNCAETGTVDCRKLFQPQAITRPPLISRV